MTEKKCYLCQSQVTRAFKKLGWNILHCNRCNLYSLDFKGSYAKLIAEYYNKGFFSGSEDRAGYWDYEADREAEEKNMKSYLRGIKQYKNSGSLLDVGCATGLFMIQAEKQEFSAHGIDVSDYAVKFAKKRFGKKVRKGQIEKTRYPKNYFDVITLFDVIEHLQDPRKVLIKIRSYLAKEGIVVINTGDAASLLARLQGKAWHFFIPPQHFHNFSQDNLKLLLDQAGYEIFRIDRKGKWISVRYLLHLAKQIQNNFIAKIALHFLKDSYLGKLPVYLNLFDNITLYARKKSTGQFSAKKN